MPRGDELLLERMTSADRFRQRRIDMGLTQWQLGTLLRYSKNTVGLWERGVVRIPGRAWRTLAELEAKRTAGQL